MASLPAESFFSDLGLSKALGLLVILPVVTYYFAHAFYNLAISPLRHIPGPKLWAISKIPNAVVQSSGDGHKRMLGLHQKYGEVVRISPDHVSFLTPSAWRGLMGYQKDEGGENQKDPVFFDAMKDGIVGTHTEAHRRNRRVLGPAFSAQALLEQEPLITRYIDLLISRLRERCGGGAAPLDVVDWYNWTTFDIIGDLAFAEPFGCLEGASYHPWVAMIFSVVRQATILTQITYVWPGVQYWLRVFAGKAIDDQIREYETLVKEKVAKRRELGTSRPDIMEAMIRGGSTGTDKLTDIEIETNARTLIMAGSETTATTLSGATFLLCTHPEVLHRLTEEVRSTFASEAEITFTSVQKLKYMLAVLRETMRVFPAAAGEIPRVIPPAGKFICGKFLPGGTLVGMPQWPLYHDSRNFARPDDFIPDRWLDDSLFPNDKRDAFHPFSIGPRDCIGQNLALVEMRSILARIVWNFDLRIDSASKDWMKNVKVFTLYEKGPLPVYMTPRNTKSH
ncbi:cytochrome P450 monooxygenase [Xylariales sp. PMI_506]|nr:cytochrome P450 monooxygenase [Xylariales sp. PMI_506]